MTLSKKTIDHLAASGFSFEEISHIKAGMEDARA
jgi:SOS response regulatory protein OraA/RecX